MNIPLMRTSDDWGTTAGLAVSTAAPWWRFSTFFGRDTGSVYCKAIELLFDMKSLVITYFVELDVCMTKIC